MDLKVFQDANQCMSRHRCSNAEFNFKGHCYDRFCKGCITATSIKGLGKTLDNNLILWARFKEVNICG